MSYAIYSILNYQSNQTLNTIWESSIPFPYRRKVYNPIILSFLEFIFI